jgi:predicted PurR-regulated permease PerM
VTIATGTPTDVAIMVVWTLVFNLVTGNIVSPLVYGKTVHLHPAVVLVAIPAGSAIAGIVGMFLVVPFIGVVATVWRTVLEVIAVPRDRSAGRSSAEGPPAATGPMSGSPASVVPQPPEGG